ncbi:heavy metal translocating P-type ATPase [Rhodomicrobium lacus]|uniref:heavy metal translocating P-type ATPase n=1 Tax=Rhodomicrobium lacus TaxID=2498452 RepID=UPI0026E3244B|nr:heavy metal translocating P-type ATPase [Rhodomicrobium lacus]WKW50245.1 heavy metal translocating P-type ATPase [Rhodomicrobium lacus]
MARTIAADALGVEFKDAQPDAAASPETIRAPSASRTITLAVEDMHCGGCMRKVETALLGVPGVAAARANLSARRATVIFDRGAGAVAPLVDALDKAGFKAAELAPETVDNEKNNPARPLLARLAVAGFAAANIMLLSVSVWSGKGGGADDPTHALFHWLSAVIALPVVAYAGQPFFSSAWGVLKRGRVNMDVPISLAIWLSAIMSLYQTFRGTDQVYFDACVTLLFFLLIGRYLDQRVRIKARGAAENLIGLQSRWAHVIAQDGTVERLPSRLVEPGMRIAVAAGERFPADGVIAIGTTTVDESLITGETTPRTAAVDAVVYAGSVNLGGPVEMEARAAESDTLLAQIGRLMATAEQARGRYVRLADRAARFYAPMVHSLALASFIGWMIAGAGWEHSLTIAIAVLIITCPCALALAVPAVQVAASARLFDKGILLKAPDGLERLAETDVAVFDKTGTLTAGIPSLANGDAIDDATLKSASALAAASRHPYAQAVAQAAKARFGAVSAAGGVEEKPGFGLRWATDGGEERLGSAAWCGVDDAQASSASLWYTRPGAAPVAFRFEDKLREDAAATVDALTRAGYRVELLSGDRIEAVASAASAAHIAEWRAGLKPDEKIARLDKLKAEGHRVLMVGDGLNDAPALAAAHASASPSSAADISQTASDAVFQGAKLSPVVELLATAKKARRMSFQNFAIAFGYNIVFVPLAIAGFVNPLVAAIAMSTSSILVTVNAVRLRTAKLEIKA